MKDDSRKPTQPDAAQLDPLRPRKADGAGEKLDSDPHIYRKHVCITDARGFPTHRNQNPFVIRVDATDGFIPLWAEGVTLRWRFQERGMRQFFADPEAAKAKILHLFGEAVDAWGDAAPVRFKQVDDAADFEMVMRTADDCDGSGCVLAATFFPDGGRHEFVMYPKLFTQIHKEQVDTFIHEIGHIFGLRHFFANVSETRWPSRLFGRDNPLSIMNYNNLSELTDDDRSDLKRLYEWARDGRLTEIDGAPIRLVRPYSSLRGTIDPISASSQGMAAIAVPSPTTKVQVLTNGRTITIE
jgi:hypothetical protein